MRQFMTFSSIGIINTIADLFVLNILIFIFGNSLLWQFSVYKGISFVFACSLIYISKSHLTFKDKNLNLLKYFKFIIASLSGMFINILFSTLIFSYLQNLHYEIIIKSTISAVIGSMISFIWNYFIYKKFIFKKII